MFLKLISKLQNAQMAYHSSLSFKNTGFCTRVLDILWDSGFIRGYKVISETKLIIFLLYEEGMPLLKRLVVLSKTTKRLYLSHLELSKLSNLNGILIVSNILGIMTIEEAVLKGHGGEVIAYFE